MNEAFSKEELEEVENLSYLQMAIDKIAIFLGKDLSLLQKLMRQKESEFYQHVMRGRIRSEAEIRKVILTAAKNGSSPAQKDFIQFIKETKLKDR